LETRRYLEITPDIFEELAKLPLNKHLTTSDRATIAQTTIAVCPASLWNLHCFLNLEPGSRAAYVDGTHNLVFDASVFVPFGGMDVQ
jgi:hypothetical protein